jgi:hypothetical protein
MPGDLLRASPTPHWRGTLATPGASNNRAYRYITKLSAGPDYSVKLLCRTEVRVQLPDSVRPPASGGFSCDLGPRKRDIGKQAFFAKYKGEHGFFQSFGVVVAAGAL